MKANKVTVTITVETLCIDAVSHVVDKAMVNINNDFENGSLTADDGDTVSWSTEYEAVEF